MAKKLTSDYVAGLFDGEGHVTIDKNCKGLQIGITNTNLNIIKMLKKKYGGRIMELKRYFKNHSKTWQWVISRKHLFIKFLDDIDMKVIIKIPQVFAAECFVSTMLDCGGNRRYGHAKELLSEINWKVRREALENLRKFNRKRR